MWDDLWIDADFATMQPERPFGLIADGTLATEEGRIAWLRPRSALPGPPETLARRVHSLNGRLVTPGLIDPHTHVLFAGDGLVDFEVLIAGGGRAEMFAAGGGVPGMVRQTREASDEEIYAAGSRRVAELIAAGVTTLESKSGSGLDEDSELRLLRLSRQLGRDFPIDIVNTFLGAHGLPPEYADAERDAYVDLLCERILPRAINEGLVDQVDGFCDAMGFSHAQISRQFDLAAAHGLPVKLHADQYTDFSAGALVALYGGLSADHLEYASEATVAAMAEAGTVATLLPGANWTLRDPKKPPVELFRRYGLTMALATNNNAVSSPTTSPTMMMNMACHLFGLTTEEALAGFTRGAARALGVQDDRGMLQIGMRADLAIWRVAKPGELAYRIGDNPCDAVVKNGSLIYERAPIAIAGRAW